MGFHSEAARCKILTLDQSISVAIHSKGDSLANLIAVGDVLEVKLYCASSNQRSINVRHYKCVNVAGTGATDIDFATRLATLLSAHYIALISSQAAYMGLSVQHVFPIRRPKTVNVVGNGIGGVQGEQLPRQTCGLIKLLSNTATRKGRGRMYVAFPGEADNDGTAHPSGDYADRLEALANDLIIQLVAGQLPNTSTLDPVLFNRPTGATIPVTDMQVRGVWATQRRRSDVAGGDREPF